MKIVTIGMTDQANMGNTGIYSLLLTARVPEFVLPVRATAILVRAR